MVELITVEVTDTSPEGCLPDRQPLVEVRADCYVELVVAQVVELFSSHSMNRHLIIDLDALFKSTERVSKGSDEADEDEEEGA